MDPCNKRQLPYFLTYRQRITLYRERHELYKANPELPFATLDKLGVLICGRWMKTELGASISSIHQCLNDCDTAEVRAEVLRQAQSIIYGQLFEFGRDELAIHTTVALLGVGIGFVTAYVSTLL